ncbi:ABC transporter substrate-binding protein [Rossellomorea sp. DUT-2]|uniref:ABC transporter substrate-binding protein n=1 Tax=Rossellomorea sp. DUT-2 TaxID=3412021 RepID=UPI003D167518
MKKSGLNSLLLSIILVVFAGCSNGEEVTSTKEVKPENESYSVTDDRGEEISFEKVPETVISLQPSNTEILFAIGAGDKVTGATEYDNYPEEAKEIKRVSDSMTVNAEEVIALKPEVVIAYTTGDDAGVKQLEEAGLNVFVIQSAQTFEDVYGDIEQIATVMGVEKKGNELVDGIKQQISDVKEKVSTLKEKEQVYFEISPSPDIYTAGAETFQQEILETAGVENIFVDQKGWVKVAEEEIIKRNPNMILTTVGYVDEQTAEIKSRESWKDVHAVKNGQVYFLDSDIMSRPGPRIGEAVELTAKTVYPELFSE